VEQRYELRASLNNRQLAASQGLINLWLANGKLRLFIPEL